MVLADETGHPALASCAQPRRLPRKLVCMINFRKQTLPRPYAKPCTWRYFDATFYSFTHGFICIACNFSNLNADINKYKDKPVPTVVL